MFEMFSSEVTCQTSNLSHNPDMAGLSPTHTMIHFSDYERRSQPEPGAIALS